MGLANAQTPVRLEFEVASVKSHTRGAEDEPSRFNRCTAGRLVATNTPVKSVLEWAWDARHRFQAPAWVSEDGDRFDIEAKAAREISLAECRQMVGALLADRFQFQAHWETREQNAYALVQVRCGTKLKPANMENPGPDEGIWLAGAKIGAKGWDLATLAWQVSTFYEVGIPVVDKTELKGLLQFKLDWTNFPQNVSDKPGIF